MKRVLININFKDAYTDELYVAGEYANLTEERITEIKAVNPNFVTVAGNVEKPATKTTTKKATEKPATKTTEKTVENDEKPSVENLIDDLDNSTEE